MSAVPQTREQYSVHLPALRLLSNLGWRILTTAQCLLLRGSNREVLQTRPLPKPGHNSYSSFNTTATPLLTHAQPWRFFFLGR